MSRIKAFRFKWTDAWGNIDSGYDSTLETSDDGKAIIRFLVNKIPYTLDLTGREEAFIEDLKFVEKWNNNSYDWWIEDGYSWNLFFTFDDIVIVTNGHNGFPPDFADFLNILHNKYGVPKAKCEPDEKALKHKIKNTVVEKDDRLNRRAVYDF